MSSGCVTGKAVRKPTAPLSFRMDTGVLCTALGSTNSLCSFADFIFQYLIEAYSTAISGFLIDIFVKAITDSQALRGYYNSRAGKFDLAIATKAKKILNLIQSVQDVLEALNSLNLEIFDTDDFCEANPLLTPVTITYQMIVAAFIPIGSGFDDLLEAVTKNWIIIKFAEYCQCEPERMEPLPGFPPRPSQYKQISNFSCVGDASQQASLFDTLSILDDLNESTANNIANASIPRRTFAGDFPQPEIQDAYEEWLLLDPQNINNYPGDFPQYNLARNESVRLRFESEPDRLFPEVDRSVATNGFDLSIGSVFKTKFFRSPTPNIPGVTNQIFLPGQEPPCNCVLILDFEKLQSSSVIRKVFIDWSGAIRFTGPILPFGFQPRDGFQIDNAPVLLGSNAFAFPRLIFTSASCPSYIVITDQNFDCLDFPTLCDCREIITEATVKIRPTCDTDDIKDIDIVYKEYLGISCDTIIVEYPKFVECGEQPLVGEIELTKP